MSKALGAPDSDPKSFQFGVKEVRKGDLVLLTSDGVHDNLTHEEIEALLEKAKSPEEAAAFIKEAALKRSREDKNKSIRAKPDDVSVVAVEVK